MGHDNEFPLNDKARLAAEKLVDWHSQEGIGNVHTVLFTDEGKGAGHSPTFATQIAGLVAERTGAPVEYVECPKSLDDVRAWVDSLGPLLDAGGILHLDFDGLEGDTEKYAVRLLESIRDRFSTNPGPLVIIAETSLPQAHMSPSVRARFDEIQEMETQRPEQEPGLGTWGHR